MKYYFILFLSIISIHCLAQLDSLKAEVSLVGSFGSQGYAPFYLTHNQFGKLDPTHQDGYFEGMLFFPLLTKDKFSVETGINYIVKPNVQESFFHQAFLNIKYGDISFRIGKNEINNDWYNDQIGSGSLFQSQNARTITKAGLGIWNYTPVPFAKFLSVKGFLEIGTLENDRPVKDAYIHEKSAYFKSNDLPINPFIGLSHVVLFGGTSDRLGALPSSFFEAFFARPALNSGNIGDSLNAAGAHFGVFDFGFEIPIESSLLKLSFQQPISDKSGFQSNFTQSRDYAFILEVKFEDHPFLKSIMYENINTTHQSGEGLPDPYINNQAITIGELEDLPDYDAYVLQQFGIVAQDLSFDELLGIVENENNFGLSYSGRDNYYNNLQYPKGNTFHDMAIGNPLFTTRREFMNYTGTDVTDNEFIINNRILSHHIGIEADYKGYEIYLRATFVQNYGTYSGKYKGYVYSWDLDPDYYFLNIAASQYLGLEIKKSTKSGLQYRGMIGVDAGDYGGNSGLLLGITYRLK